MLTAADVLPALIALLFMGAAVGFLMAFEYRAQHHQLAEQHGALLRRFDAFGAVVVRELRHAPASPASVRREINEAEAALRADEEKPPTAPPDERRGPAAPRGGAS